MRHGAVNTVNSYYTNSRDHVEYVKHGAINSHYERQRSRQLGRHQAVNSHDMRGQRSCRAREALGRHDSRYLNGRDQIEYMKHQTINSHYKGGEITSST